MIGHTDSFFSRTFNFLRREEFEIKFDENLAVILIEYQLTKLCYGHLDTPKTAHLRIY